MIIRTRGQCVCVCGCVHVCVRVREIAALLSCSGAGTFVAPHDFRGGLRTQALIHANTRQHRHNTGSYPRSRVKAHY